LIRLIKGIDVALLYQKKKFQPPVSNIPYTFTKKSSTTEIEKTNTEEKQMMNCK
jgi:hypothetical protein